MRQYPQEQLSAELYSALVSRYASVDKEFELSNKGAGIHWTCRIRRGHRACNVSSFWLDSAEYYISLIDTEKEIATSRENSVETTLAMIDGWILGDEIFDLYARFENLDRNKRQLLSIEQELQSKRTSQLYSSTITIENEIADIYRLNISKGERECVVSIWGKNEHPNAEFRWDRFTLFDFSLVDFEQFENILIDWVANQYPPSRMKEKYQSIEIETVAQFFEIGRKVEGEFWQSWNSLDQFIGLSNGWTEVEKVKAFISACRDLGYDRKLRAGWSLNTLILSRSRRHGLRSGQSAIAFDFRENELTIKGLPQSDFRSLKRVYFKIELNSEIADILDILSTRPID